MEILWSILIFVVENCLAKMNQCVAILLVGIPYLDLSYFIIIEVPLEPQLLTLLQSMYVSVVYIPVSYVFAHRKGMFSAIDGLVSSEVPI